MSATLKSEGKVLMVPSPSGRTSGDIMELGTDAGGFGAVALDTVVSAVDCPGMIAGVHAFAKASATATWSQGVPIYHSGSNIVTDSSTSNHLIGVAAKSATSGPTTADVLLSVGAIGL